LGTHLAHISLVELGRLNAQRAGPTWLVAERIFERGLRVLPAESLRVARRR
jgi:hypothetical protein